MEQKKMKFGTKKKWAIIAGAALAAVVVVIVLICTLGKKEEAYRNIRVSEVTGTVVVNREGMENLAVYANMNLLSGDEIITEAGARVSLRLDDDKYVILDEQSKLTLHATGSAEDSKTTLHLEYGAVFSDIKNKLSNESGYEVVTPASTMSVRGTQFEIVYRGGQVKILTYEGAVYVAPKGASEGRMVSAGQWDVVIETEDGTCRFEGETKSITAEDVGLFVNEYLEEEGIVFEEITAEPEVTPAPTATPTPTVTPKPTATPTPTATPKPTVTPVPTATLKPIATPTPTATPKPTATPVPTVRPEGETVIRYYIPNPPKNLLPQGNTYTITYENNMLVISDGTNTDYYAADAAPYAVHACTLEENAAPYIMEATNNYLSAALKERLQVYHPDAIVKKCYFWCDATKTQWYDWEKKLSSVTLVDGGLNLYPAYTIYVPENDGVRGWYEISCLPVLITVEETGELFCLSLPAGATLKCESTNGTMIQWVVNGGKTDTNYVGHGTLTDMTLSVAK